MSLEGITYFDEVLQKKATKTQKMRFWYIAQKIIFLKDCKGNENLKIFRKIFEIIFLKLKFSFGILKKCQISFGIVKKLK